MITNYDINMLYQAAFGFRGLPYPYRPLPHPVNHASDFVPGDPEAVAKAEGYELSLEAAKKYTEGLPYTHSAIGAPLYMPTGFNVSGSIVQLPNEPIVTCSVKKKIIETALAGNTRKGTVKEIINTEDWKIKIQGLCIDMTKQGYPEDEVESIQQLFSLNRSIELIHYVANNVFEIKNVVITGLNWHTMKGRPFSQAFTIDLVSDEDFLLIIE
jgi:hypothetical protein